MKSQTQKTHLARKFSGFLPILVGLLLILAIAQQVVPVRADQMPQIPTGTIATVTGTPGGITVTVRTDIGQPSISVRSGPSTVYEKIGVLLLGQKVAAVGRTPGGEWIQIAYPGISGSAWVYAAYVNVTPGEMKVIEPPPLPTLSNKATLDPTMAAQFVVTVAPTRLATFTPPAPLSVPTFAAESTRTNEGLPMGLVIIAVAAIGLFLGVFSLTQGR